MKRVLLVIFAKQLADATMDIHGVTASPLATCTSALQISRGRRHQEPQRRIFDSF